MAPTPIATGLPLCPSQTELASCHSSQQTRYEAGKGVGTSLPQRRKEAGRSHVACSRLGQLRDPRPAVTRTLHCRGDGTAARPQVCQRQGHARGSQRGRRPAAVLSEVSEGQRGMEWSTSSRYGSRSEDGARRGCWAWWGDGGCSSESPGQVQKGASGRAGQPQKRLLQRCKSGS